jgi:hypothetical protein
MLPPPALGERWHEGRVVYSNEDGELAEPLSHFFHRLVVVRDRLMTLAAMIDARDDLLPSIRTTWTTYIRRCFGSLTTYNILFRERDDYFSSKG